MERYLTADDILTLLFISFGVDSKITDKHITSFISLLFSIRKQNKRDEIIELDMPRDNNFDSTMFSFINDEYMILNSYSKEDKQNRIVKMYKTILDKDKTDFNEDIESLIMITKENYIKDNNSQVKIR